MIATGRRRLAVGILGALILGLVAVPSVEAGQAERHPVQNERTQALTQKDAKFYLGRYLKSEARRYWVWGHHKKIVKCKNLSRIRVRCKVSWYYKEKYFFHGSGTIFYKPNDSEHYYARLNIDVDRI